MEQLYAVFVKGVRFFLWRQLGPQDLDDKVHDVFLIITQSIQRGELREPDRLMGYVRTVVRRQVAVHIDSAVQARRNQQSIDPAMTLSDHQPDPERRAIEQENQDVALRMLGGLPKRDREVLVRFYLQEQTAEEICRDLKLTRDPVPPDQVPRQGALRRVGAAAVFPALRLPPRIGTFQYIKHLVRVLYGTTATF